MASEGKEPIRLTWAEWQRGRAAKREALAKKGLSEPCRRSTAKPAARAAALAQSALKA
ncbi:MAG: hypothetical protein ILM98_02700 [Kiritimatiellae bacterium]|nr:hypothetical protein [Kiritimatiellia bacterium]